MGIHFSNMAASMENMLSFEGCNLFRQRLVLSTLSGKSVKIKKIRAKEDDPGVKGMTFYHAKMMILTVMLKPLHSSYVNTVEHPKHSYIGPMTPYTPLNIANIHNIDLIPATPFKIFWILLISMNSFYPPYYLPNPTTLYSFLLPT